jgi:hypothetical protein
MPSLDHHAIEAISQWKFEPGWRLRVVTPILKSGGYQLQTPTPAASAIQFLSATITKDGETTARTQPLVLCSVFRPASDSRASFTSHAAAGRITTWLWSHPINRGFWTYSRPRSSQIPLRIAGRGPVSTVPGCLRALPSGPNYGNPHPMSGYRLADDAILHVSS